MTRGEKELIALTEKWMTELIKISNKYEVSIGKLKEAKDVFIELKKSKLYLLKDMFIPLVPLITLLGVVIFLHFLKCGVSIKIPGGLEINKPCEMLIQRNINSLSPDN